MDLSSSNIKKFLTFSLIFQETETPKKFLIFSQEKAFLIFQETEFSFISGNESPEKIYYIS